jgi:hypothetical protein
MLPFLVLGALGVADLVAAIGALRARRAEELGEGRFELLRDQHERPQLVREERRMLLDELQRERRRESNSSCGSTRIWSLSKNSNASQRSWSWSARDVRTTIANVSAWVRSWSVNAWLAPGISGTSNALSETFMSCSKLSRLRRRAYGQTS